MFKMRAACYLANFFAGIVPAISAKISYGIWVRVQRSQRPKREEECFKNAKRSVICINDENIAVYVWGQGPQVLLVHGWNGRATQYFAMVEGLLAQGYSVLAFDAPGHGDSSGKQTNLNQITLIIKHLYQAHGVFETIIAHSFGFMVAVNSLTLGVKSKTMIGIASPADYNLLLKAFIAYFGLNSKAEAVFTNFLKIKYGLKSFDEISIHYLAKNMDLPCLIIHDESDRQVPVSEAHKIVDVWRGSELHVTKGCGHSRILYSQDVIDKCIAFIDRGKLC